MTADENKNDENNDGNNEGNNGNPPTPQQPSVKPNNWKVILLGTYLFVMLIAGLYILGTLMMAETPEQAAQTILTVEAANKKVSDNNPTNSNKANNSNTSNTNKAGENKNSNNASDTNSKTNINGSTNNAANAQIDNSNPSANQNANSTTDEEKKDTAPTTVPKKISIVFFSTTYHLTGDGYFFWVILFSGFVGGLIRCIFSFFRHLGFGDFSFNWIWYYLMLPYGGAALSLVLYFVIRGGFYSSAIGKDLALNLFSFAALGALTGLFSENAMEKLKLVSESLLTPVRSKGNKPKNNGDTE